MCSIFNYLYIIVIGDNMDKFNDPGNANGQPFSTRDRDNDNNWENCAVRHKSAWWYTSCRSSDFNPPYIGKEGQMVWSTWRYNVSASILMIRRTS